MSQAFNLRLLSNFLALNSIRSMEALVKERDFVITVIIVTVVINVLGEGYSSVALYPK